MNKIFKVILILSIIVSASLLAFEDVFSTKIDFGSGLDDPQSGYYLTGSPAGMIYEKNKEVFSICTAFGDNAYKRTYDPSTTQNISALFNTVRRINESSFFMAGISYEDLRQRDVFGSREKDFYDDYFSTIDSSSFNTGYYGPQLNLLYNVKIGNDLYVGISGNYGVERGLQDTFPETITIMRNSTYRVGVDYRKANFGFGLHGRYYDDQSYYESVKSYSDVKAKTYIGYNVFYNENPTSTSKKKRNRSGFEYGGNIRLGGKKAVVLNVNMSGLRRVSRTEMYTSYSKPRGLWQRKGIHLLSDLTIRAGETVKARLYGDYLHYNDWGASLISNALVLENEESYSHAGGLLEYQPSMMQKAYVGAEIGKVAYSYVEYVFPFEDERSGTEWKFFGGAEFYLSSKTKLNFNLEYGKEVPKFYWNTDYFQKTGVIINLEQLFSFGYIDITFENINKKPANDSQTVSLMQIGLSYRRR
jgi:hypothetical protein